MRQLYDFWMQLTRLVDWLCNNWQQPDEGIWETRGGKREFAYSRLLSWVALDRAIRLAQKRSFPAPFDRWYRVRDNIYAYIYQNFWDPKLRPFVQDKGAQTVDASCLLMPLVRFTAPIDPRWISTMKRLNNRWSKTRSSIDIISATPALTGSGERRNVFHVLVLVCGMPVASG